MRPQPGSEAPVVLEATPDETFLRWFGALEERYLADLTFSEVRRGVQALSALYVQNRGQGLERAMGGAGKRAAFAMFYAPLHFLLIRAVLGATGAASHPVGEIRDLGCGTGAGGAAWALEARGHLRLKGIERHPWAAREARWSWRMLGLDGRVVQTDLTGVRLPGAGAGILLAYTANELGPEARRLLLEKLIRAAQRGAAVLVVEPISRGILPWWGDSEARFGAVGGIAGAWRLRVDLPERLRLMDRAAGLDHSELTGRTLWVPGVSN